MCYYIGASGQQIGRQVSRGTGDSSPEFFNIGFPQRNIAYDPTDGTTSDLLQTGAVDIRTDSRRERP